MKDDILISIMEYCIDKDKTCVGCLNHINSFRPCQKTISKHALDLINRQKAEIAELKSELTILTQANEHLQELCKEEQAKVETAKQKVIDSYKKLKTVKTEAIREFAHFLIDKADMSNNINISSLPDFAAEFIRKGTEV